MGKYLFRVPIAANARLAGRWQGRQLGLISFVTSAAVFNGAMFDWAFATEEFWGSIPEASATRLA